MKGKKRNKGSAMVLVIAMMAVIVSLCLTLLFSASSLNKNINSEVSQEQVRIAATSMSKNVRSQLTSGSGDLYEYLWNNISLFGVGNWTYYNEDEFGHTNKASVTRSFSAADADSNNTFTIDVYWQAEGSVIENANVPPEAKYSNISLVVNVAAVGPTGEKHKIKTVFSALRDTSLTGGRDVVWYIKGSN